MFTFLASHDLYLTSHPTELKQSQNIKTVVNHSWFPFPLYTRNIRVSMTYKKIPRQQLQQQIDPMKIRCMQYNKNSTVHNQFIHSMSNRLQPTFRHVTVTKNELASFFHTALLACHTQGVFQFPIHKCWVHRAIFKLFTAEQIIGLT